MSPPRQYWHNGQILEDTVTQMPICAIRNVCYFRESSSTAEVCNLIHMVSPPFVTYV